MDFENIRALAKAAIRADKSAPVAYSYKHGETTEDFSYTEVNSALRAQLNELCSDYKSYRRNKPLIFEIIEESIDEVLPKRVEEIFNQFAEIKSVPQGDKATFRVKITDAARQRAKTFVTRVGLAGRYETFMLDGKTLVIDTGAIGAAYSVGFEEFLDGRYDFAELADIVAEGMQDYIAREICKALAGAIEELPDANKAEFAGFDETTMDELLSIADAYGTGPATIYATFEFAAAMKPDAAWASSGMKEELWKRGAFTVYKGHNVVLLPQSMEDETNTTKVIDPAQAYIMPGTSEKPVKIVYEGQTAVREANQNDDWSTDIQTYKKVGVGVLTSHWMCSYRNTNLKKDTRTA